MRSSDSKERILEAARTLFVEHGYAGVSTDVLSRKAQSSKSTIYRYFGDMAGVLEAVVSKEGDAFLVSSFPLPQTEAAFWDALEEYGVELLKLLNTEFCLQLDRTLHEEARRHPDIAAVFYENAYGRAHKDLTRMIGDGQEKGFIRKGVSAADLADALLSMWEGLPLVRARLALTDKPYGQPKKRIRLMLDVLFPYASRGKGQ